MSIEQLIGKKLPVLDDGFIRLVDTMGNDSSVCQAARVSYGAGTKSISSDRTLIRYLLRMSHTTPFEMCEIKLHVRVPMDTWRQWIRHRMASTSEYSTRYSKAIDSQNMTNPDEWRVQGLGNKQGSEGFLDGDTGLSISQKEIDTYTFTKAAYNEMLEHGIAREQARKILPLSTYTEAYWKIDLHNLLHFLKLRLDSHAQYEIRMYAETIAEIVKVWCPMVWEAFEDYKLKSMILSSLDVSIIEAVASNKIDVAVKLMKDQGLLNLTKDGKKTRNRERDELKAKLERLGIQIFWEVSDESSNNR